MTTLLDVHLSNKRILCAFDATKYLTLFASTIFQYTEYLKNGWVWLGLHVVRAASLVQTHSKSKQMWAYLFVVGLIVRVRPAQVVTLFHCGQRYYIHPSVALTPPSPLAPCATFTTIKFFPVPGNFSTRKSLEMHLTLRLFTVIQAGFEPHRHILKF